MAIKASLRIATDDCGVGDDEVTEIGDKALEGTFVGPPVGFPIKTGACVGAMLLSIIGSRVGASVPRAFVGGCEGGLVFEEVGNGKVLVAGATVSPPSIVGAIEDWLKRGVAGALIHPFSRENHAATPTTAQHVKIAIIGVSHPFDGLFLPSFVDASTITEIALIYIRVKSLLIVGADCCVRRSITLSPRLRNNTIKTDRPLYVLITNGRHHIRLLVLDYWSSFTVLSQIQRGRADHGEYNRIMPTTKTNDKYR